MSAERACAFIVYCNKIKERKKKKTSKEWRVVKRDIIGLSLNAPSAVFILASVPRVPALKTTKKIYTYK